MGIIDKVCGKIGISNSDERDDNDFLTEDERELGMTDEESSGQSKVVDFHSTAASLKESAMAHMKVMVIEPKSFDDAQQVANCLKEKRPIIINFENTDEAAAKRIIDFISGTTYALSGEIKKVSRNVFLCAPSNVNISYSQEQKSITTDMPWMK